MYCRRGLFVAIGKAIDKFLHSFTKRISVLFVGTAMRTGEASQTAEFMAVFRASETARRGGRVLVDPLAASLLPGKLGLVARAYGCPPLATLLDGYIDMRWPGARTSGIARTRLIDDWIEQSLDGIDQVVLLGAGFDTRAWRLRALAQVQVFEVDHPDTAALKRERLRAAGIDFGTVKFVAVDFDRDSFDDLLVVAGFDRSRPAIVVWEGVSQYLDGDAVCGVMRWAGSLAAGSRFIFTYVHEGVLDGSVVFHGAERAIAAVDASGEPWRFGLLPEELPAFLRERGLSLLVDLGADEYRTRVMGPRAHAMRGYSFYHSALAEVAHA
jgi:methyltransferase (TIGR00027 family)